ncbi:ATP-binding protein [Trichloromonas sp.]|uniref:ATP-binding protein n=1 Tax=Trichloromonas sp. TaxID=3069249 RepID=UPI001D214922|nr:ATP-binding protein [Desulfuromonadaceae bacterium]MDY0269079.1 ATP-binding protein [Trichloromonas sp.]
MTKLAKLPIGIQTFSEIRSEGYAYVDKTPLLHRLVTEGKYYFLARPRRFGKSLLVSTLQALFEGRREFFKGLSIEDKWDWDTVYPVIALDFSGVARSLEDMQEDVSDLLTFNQQRLGVTCDNSRNLGGCFKQLIWNTYQKYGQKVVILVDEYDKFIVDNLDQIEVARQGRDVLRDLYSIIKSSDAYIRFTLLTGVSKFSKMSVFSGLNNLKDISLNPTYATICGYTERDLDTTFAAHLEGADRDEVRRWYNGYNFLGEPVYNPFDILLFIDNGQQFKNYWFATGTPTFLITLIQQNNYYIPQLDKLDVSEELIDSYDIDNIQLEPILFQAGYLTVKAARQTDFGMTYSLGFPNREVIITFNNVVVSYLTGNSNVLPIKNQLLTDLKKQEIVRFKQTLTSLFAAIPYNNYVNNTIGSYEGYYASVIYAYLASLGLDLVAEDVTSTGRIDLTIHLSDVIYILEFKVDGSGDALAQIKERNYQQKYLAEGKKILLIGIDFDSASRNVTGFAWEAVEPASNAGEFLSRT